MASPSVTYTFSNGATADASQVNQNFTDIINGLTDGTKDLSVSALTCAGNVAFNGTTTIGNASSDDLTITASLASSITIKTTNSYDFGSTTKGLQRVYFGSSAGSNTTRLAGAAVSADVQITLPSMTGTLALQFGVRTETDNYTALLTDGVILMNVAAAKTVSLPAASTAAGKIYIIKKVDSTLFTVTIDPNGSETIDGVTTTTINTQNESIHIYCDGSAWQIIERRIPSVLVSYGVLSITSSGTPPSKGSTTVDRFMGQRIGNRLHFVIEYYQTTAGSVGTSTGPYRITMPTGLTIDTSLVTAYAGSDSTEVTGIMGSGLYEVLAAQSSWVKAYVYDSTHISLVGSSSTTPSSTYIVGGNTAAGGSWFGLENANMGWFVTGSVPISGWSG